MQPHLTSSTTPTHHLPHSSQNDHKLPNTKSSLKSSAPKKKPSKASKRPDSSDPNQSNLPSHPPTNATNPSHENKTISSSPIKPKQDLPLADITSSKETNVNPKPAESPFTAFCKGLHLSPGPFLSVSPNLPSKGGLFFGSNEVANFISPSPLSLHIGMDNGSSSPMFSRKHITKLDFSHRLVMFKSNRDEVSIEPEEIPEKEGGPHFETPFAYDVNIASSPKFNFPLKKSIYSNTNLIPTNTRTTDIFSQNPTMEAITQEKQEEKDAPLIVRIPRPIQEEADSNQKPVDLGHSENSLKTPSPSRRVTLESINSFPDKNESQQKGLPAGESLSMQRIFSFATPLNNNTDQGAQSSAKSSVVKMKTEEGEGGDLEDSNNGQGLSSNKKKITCNCKKSKCLKLYCDCFARGQGCGKDCNCVNCLNNDENAEERNAAMNNTLERNPIAFKPKVNLAETPEQLEEREAASRVRHIKGCNCKKSGCLKKYCECFQAGAKCSEVCKCEGCKNMDCVAVVKKNQLYGNYAKPEYERHEKPKRHVHSPISEDNDQPKKLNARNSGAMEQEDEEESIYNEDEGAEEVKKYSHPRKQLFKSAHDVENKFKDFGESKEHKKEGEKQKGGNKHKEKKRKESNNLNAPKTPTSYSETQKKSLEFTPSPEKQVISGGRSRRNVRPFSHINPDEYETGK